MKINFKVGDRIHLEADAEENWTEEYGVLLSIDTATQMALVRVDEVYRDEGDDGLRECAIQQLNRVDH